MQNVVIDLKYFTQFIKRDAMYNIQSFKSTIQSINFSTAGEVLM